MQVRLVRATATATAIPLPAPAPRLFAALSLTLGLTLCLTMCMTVFADRAEAQGTSATPPAQNAGIGSAIRQSADRHGLWGSVGVGRGDAGLNCDACVRETTKAYAIHGIIGVRLTTRFLVGVESFGWLDVMGGGTDRVARGTYLIARMYPLDGSRLFLHGGLGQASFHTTDGNVAFTTRSPSLSLSAGYDWRIGEFTLTPAVTAVTSTGGKLTSDRTDNAVTENARLNMLRTSVAISWFR